MTAPPNVLRSQGMAPLRWRRLNSVSSNPMRPLAFEPTGPRDPDEYSVRTSTRVPEDACAHTIVRMHACAHNTLCTPGKHDKPGRQSGRQTVASFGGTPGGTYGADATSAKHRHC